MKKRLLPLLATLICLTAIAGGPDVTTTVTQKPLKPRIVPLPSNINAINGNGYLQITVQQITGNTPNEVIIPPTNPRWVFVRTQGKMVFFKQKQNEHPSPRESRLIVRLHTLNRMEAFDATDVIARKLKSKQLVINADDSGTISIAGFPINLYQVSADGPVKVRVHGVYSNVITLHSKGKAQVNLRGRADNLIAKLYGHSALTADYLRTDNILVHTFENAMALVLPVRSLRAFANGHSNIYYDRRPIRLTRYTLDSGNVLQTGYRI